MVGVTLPRLKVRAVAARLLGVDVRGLRHAAVNLAFAHSLSDPTDKWTRLDAGLEHPERAPYASSPWWVLHWLLPRSLVKPGDMFVDYGCGRGRIVIAAARRYRFAEVIGIDISRHFTYTARMLVERERRLRSPVRIETGDAAEFEVPDDVAHVYMFNPFRGELFRRVVAKMLESIDRRPRRLRLIYVQPEEHEQLIETGRFTLTRWVRATQLVAINAAIYTADTRR
jgi:SAM-dependent methyltransferase